VSGLITVAFSVALSPGVELNVIVRRSISPIGVCAPASDLGSAHVHQGDQRRRQLASAGKPPFLAGWPEGAGRLAEKIDRDPPVGSTT
jgi:hypothetical protein